MRCLSALSVGVLILCATMMAGAQSTNATLSGVVVDPSGNVILNATIEILNEATGVRYTSETNDLGIYTVSILPPGQYRVQISKGGFKTIIKPDIVLYVQSALVLNFTLPVGATSESVTVESGSPIIDTTDASVTTVVDSKFVANIPLNGRSFQDLISLTPGVVTASPQAGYGAGINFSGDFSVDGQRTESNYYTIDGVSANASAGIGTGVAQAGTGGVLAAATALGTTQSLLPVDSLQEFRVSSSSYSAEFGRSPGGQFSFVTRSGTDQLNGSAFDYLRNEAFDANDWFNDHYGIARPPLRQNDFGGTLGGPFDLRGRREAGAGTFFFGSYEGLRLIQPQAASVIYVPDLYMREESPTAIQPFLNAFPLQTSGPKNVDYGTAQSPNLATFIRSYSLPSGIDSGVLRVDHVFSSAASIFLRAGYTPSQTQSRNLSEVQNTSVSNQSYTAGLTLQFSPSLVSETRAGFIRSIADLSDTLDSFGSATPSDLASESGAGLFANPEIYFYYYFYGVGSTYLQTFQSGNSLGQWNIVDSISWNQGRHLVKAGVDFRRIVSPLRPADLLLEDVFYSPSAVLGDSGYVFLSKSLAATPVIDESALYIQDDCKISTALTLSLGLRWELNPPPGEANGNLPYVLAGNLSDPESLALAPHGTPLWKTPWAVFAPRLGVAWAPDSGSRNRQTVFRAGGGVFYDTDNEVAVNGFNGVGFSANNSLASASVPIQSADLSFEPSAAPPYSGSSIYTYPTHLQPPYTLEWNVSVDQSLGTPQALTLTYVGSAGRRLAQEQLFSLSALNPEFGYVYTLASGITSNYQALQVRYQRVVRTGLHALASYTWSHSLDYGSSDPELAQVRGNSDFDVRNSFNGAVTWDLPGFANGREWAALTNQWGLDGRITARSAFPVTLFGTTTTDPTTGNIFEGGLNLVPGQPVYTYAPGYPGGRAINANAFMTTSGLEIGDAPRNFARGFDEVQVNAAVRRQFPISERVHLDFRAEAFNLFNHPCFGYIDPYYGDATFGQTTQMLNHSLETLASQYQQGGSRSMQLALKAVF